MSKNSAGKPASFTAGADCTLRNAKATAASLVGLLQAGSGITIDCASVEQADITFVQTLMAAHRSCGARDLPFALTGMSDVVASAFHRAGVTPPGTVPSELSRI
ncbi:MAG TPA: STAS domain-containing protein [Bosea sp. (in: a-proteobacteria)]|jgi:anti-anti-sigma regulatory factor|uniref:STAS domain-containing protein n=1 Tax=Bosea sp. (in: a-proteobacteria) TaxID=1871050 RepID=UPI002DDCF3C8|nr:STAS domain-containing protein [Bosea sp. (in: a-proteobacteria)]HEV2552283.1 STAS domain-containing protein [Bosea sp. (in: a-proteobacteria)]